MNVNRLKLTKGIEEMGIEVKEMAGNWYYLNGANNLRYGAFKVNVNSIMFYFDVKPTCDFNALMGNELELKKEDYGYAVSYYNHIPEKISIEQALRGIRLLNENKGYVREMIHKKDK